MAIISLMAVVLGLIAVIRIAMHTPSERSRIASHFWEVSGFWAAIPCVVTAFTMAWSGLEYGNHLVLMIAAAQLVAGAAAMLVVQTRWRRMTEGLAAIALGLFSFLTGFSIGVFLMPFALTLGIAALIHSNQELTA